ncbi:MAG: hypothetical protein KDI12_13765, partial [Anaerolineae bacterium]|nr:hypothetical protein [Anaerolineae bacterium]
MRPLPARQIAWYTRAARVFPWPRAGCGQAPAALDAEQPMNITIDLVSSEAGRQTVRHFFLAFF